MRTKAIPVRANPLWLAYVLHRLSGLGLAIFLPFHFWVLSLAMTDPARLDWFLGITEVGAVKIVEFGLVFLLAVHFFGGLRLIALEWLPWSAPQKTLAAAATAASFLIALLFFLRAI
ncbi:MAG: succinate dehydrogenase, cytochrome b556 subunit [Pseudomonadota bacterium]